MHRTSQMSNNPREQLKERLRRAELTVLAISKQLGKLDDVSLAVALKHPAHAEKMLKESLAVKSLALGK